MPRALFRFYASSWRGAGHAFRCLTLAKALEGRGWTCAFITESESFDFVPAIRGYERIDPDVFYKDPVKAELLVVDHYGCDASYESRFRPYSDAIIVIDDLADRHHDCDILLDQTYGRGIDEYQQYTPPDCTLLTGAFYALLRPDFAAWRQEALTRRSKVQSIQRILVNFGGNDQANNILKTLQGLHAHGYTGAIDVVYGVIAPYKESVEAYASTMSNEINFHVNSDMTALMYSADMAIGAAGTTTWERCCLGLPSILIETADNQRSVIQNLCRDQAVIGAGYECLSQRGMLLDFDADQYAGWVERAASVCDGQGVQRILGCLDV